MDDDPVKWALERTQWSDFFAWIVFEQGGDRVTALRESELSTRMREHPYTDGLIVYGCPHDSCPVPGLDFSADDLVPNVEAEQIGDEVAEHLKGRRRKNAESQLLADGYSSLVSYRWHGGDTLLIAPEKDGRFRDFELLLPEEWDDGTD